VGAGRPNVAGVHQTGKTYIQGPERHDIDIDLLCHVYSHMVKSFFSLGERILLCSGILLKPL
jgi:hypothetical protein